MKKRVIISVTNDLSIDQRVHRVCTTLQNNGYEILLVGRIRRNSRPLKKRSYRTHRMRLLFDKGKLFYLAFNFRLFWFLLFRKCDILLSNDLDSLLPNFLVAKFRRKKLIYDSHELWTEIPELQGRSWTKRIWTWLEKRLFPRVDAAYTVNASIAKYYEEKYRIPVKYVRNFPLRREAPISTVAEPQKKLIYQGALNVGRGIELMIAAMQYLPGYQLKIIGFGTEEERLAELVVKLGLQEAVNFPGFVAFQELHEITSSASLGFSLEEDRGLSYHYTLPNKLMDYIQAQIPVIVSDLPEMRAIVDDHKLGEVLPVAERNAEDLAKRIKAIFEEKGRWMGMHHNAAKAAEELCWEKEEKFLLKIFSSVQ